jgi:hypothetical protein
MAPYCLVDSLDSEADGPLCLITPVRLDRKLLLIAPTIVLAFVVAGMVYATVQLRVLASVGDSWKDRSDFIAAVERGEKKLDLQRTTTILRMSLTVEARRTEAIAAARDLMIVLSAMALIACCVLAFGIRSVPREHWPRFQSRATNGATIDSANDVNKNA